MRLALALVAVFVAIPAAAQAPAPSDTQPDKQAPAQQPARLNLKLENPAQYSREIPKEAGSAELPALGADARPVPKDSPSITRPSSPYPSEPSAGR